MLLLIFILAVFFAMNMGGASFAASFAAAYGSRTVTHKRGVILFTVFVIIGALVLGQNVSLTLGEKLIPHEMLTLKVMVVIFASASLSMFVANMMNVPQTTSIVTVMSIMGVGLFYGQINWDMIRFLVLFWVVLPIVCFGLTYGITSYVYPPRRQNFWIYEKLVNHKKRIELFVIVASCYNAISVGANNVGNVAGPLLGAGISSLPITLFLTAIAFGLGGLIFKGPIKTAGKRIVPLGSLTASIMLFVTGSLMIIASILGIPQSIVMLKMAALFAVSSLKKGKTYTFTDRSTINTLFNWTINPLATLAISYGLCWVFLK